MIAPTAIEHWSHFTDILRDGHSVISHAPRQSLQSSILQHLRTSHTELGATHFVSIQPEDFVRGSFVNWDAFGAAFARHMRVAPTPTPDSASFHLFLSNWLESMPAARLLVAIGLGTVSSVEGRFELIVALHRCLADLSRHDALCLAVFDDYSLYYYEWWRTQGVSRWDYLHRLHLRPLERDEIANLLPECLASLPLTDVAVETEKLTGGHVALVAEILDDVIRRKGVLSADYWKSIAPRILAHSHVIEFIRRALQEDTTGLTQRAMQYDQPKPARDYGSPTVQTLRSLGVLQWTSSASARLCPGFIRDLVSDLADRSDTGEVLGTLFRDGGANIFVPTSLEISDDDITVVHLSDVHVGDPYAFRIGASDPYRHDRRSAAEMLANDLKTSGITHVDAFVFSGDFTEQASLAEFRQARDVLTNVLTAAGCSWDKAIVVAGNHDVRWIPAASDGMPATVSREEFATFRELVGKGSDSSAEVHSVVSRSGKYALVLVSLDSNLVEGPAAGGIGYVSMETLQSVQALIASQALPSTVQRVSTWVVVHHHVFPVTSTSVADGRARRVSVMANASALLSFASNWQTELILHGHEHQPSLTVSRRWPIEGARGLAQLCVAGAGSFGCRREYLGPFARNHYYIHVRRHADILIRSRMLGDEGLSWVAHDDISIPVPETSKPSEGARLPPSTRRRPVTAMRARSRGSIR